MGKTIRKGCILLIIAALIYCAAIVTLILKVCKQVL